MKYRIYTSSLIAILIVSVMFMGCGPKSIQSESLMDTPGYHVSQGLKLLDRQDYQGAKESFERASRLDPDFAEAFSGLALVAAYERQYDTARDLADKAVGKDSKNPWTFIVRGRVKSMERDGDHWLLRAEEDFKRALDLKAQGGEVYYWWGVACKNAFEFDRAGKLFSQVIEYKDDWSAKADAEYALVQKIMRAAPGTLIGKKIALVENVSRADLATLFMEELKLADILAKERPAQFDTGFKAPEDPTKIASGQSSSTGDIATDISDNWAKSWIKDVIDLGVMEVSPDNKFYPDEKVTRSEFCLFIQNIMIAALHDEGLATRYIGEDSRFNDMRSGTATYNAAALCVDRGILQANLDGTFKPMSTVSGADALLTIRQFQNQLRRSF